MVPSPAAPSLRMAHELQCIVNEDDSAVFPVLSLVTLTFDLDIQTRPSQGSKTSPCKFGANLLSSSRDMSDKQTKKQNLSQTVQKKQNLTCVR